MWGVCLGSRTEGAIFKGPMRDRQRSHDGFLWANGICSCFRI
jgi:hypothetical protein